MPWPGFTPALRQLVVALAKALQAHGDTYSFLRRLEDDEGCARAGAQLPDQVVVHYHFGDTAVGEAAHEPGAANVRLVDLEPETRGQQHTERRQHTQQPSFLIGGF